MVQILVCNSSCMIVTKNWSSTLRWWQICFLCCQFQPGHEKWACNICWCWDATHLGWHHREGLLEATSTLCWVSTCFNTRRKRRSWMLASFVISVWRIITEPLDILDPNDPDHNEIRRDAMVYDMFMVSVHQGIQQPSPHSMQTIKKYTIDHIVP